MAISDMEARLASVSLRQLRLFEAVGRLASVRRPAVHGDIEGVRRARDGVRAAGEVD